MPPVRSLQELAAVMRHSGDFPGGDDEIRAALTELRDITGGKDSVNVGIKWVIQNIEIAKEFPQDRAGRFAAQMAEDIATRGAWAD